MILDSYESRVTFTKTWQKLPAMSKAESKVWKEEQVICKATTHHCDGVLWVEYREQENFVWPFLHAETEREKTHHEKTHHEKDTSSIMS